MIHHSDHAARLLALWLFAWVPAAAIQPMSVEQSILWAAVISIAGGAFAALRVGKFDTMSVITVAGHTGVLGASIAMVGYYWTESRPELHYPVIGACGVLSLGGLATIDFVLSASQRFIVRWMEKRSSSDDPPKQPPSSPTL